jgi:tetratricopeptide (TPR) repeat protein
MEHVRKPVPARTLALVRGAGWVLLLTALCGGSAVFGEPAPGLPRAEPSALVVDLSGQSEPLSVERFGEAALVFSGVADAELDREKARLARLIGEAREATGGIADARGQAEAILGFLHARVLRRYEERQTRIDVMLSSGAFNCVSSGVLYALVAKALGFEVWGVRTEDHAFCRIRAGGREFDVETTSPYGFDPGTRKEFKDSFGKVTGFTYVPPSSYGRREDIGERSLLALILYNRTAFSSDVRHYEEAVPPAVDAHALLDDRESYERMIVSFLNLGSWYGLNRRFAPAVDFVGAAAERCPEPRLSSLLEDLLHNWILSLVGQGQFDQAEDLLDARRGDGLLADGEWRSLTVYLYQMRAQEAARSNFAAAAGWIMEGLNKTGPDDALDRSFEVYIHNQVVSLLRGGQLEEALAVIDDAMGVAPRSALLQKDRALVTEQMSGTP